MSVLQHGGECLQRRLTQMYTDTKTSCDSVTTAKALDDPELVAVDRGFRVQRDRLLAWGLDWSDRTADEPDNIDESVTQAGFSDVVASVMSSIQDILIEAYRIQRVLPPQDSGDPPSKESLNNLPMRTHWSDEDISRSKALLSDLTACNDTLYDLSLSRKNMTSSQSVMKSRARPSPITPQTGKGGDDFYDRPSLRKAYEAGEKGFAKSFLNPFLIDRSALQLSGSSHDTNPPPYEVVSASANSRVVGRLKASASPLLAGTKESTVSILVEYAPMVLETQTAVPIPANQRLEKVHKTSDQLIQNSRVSHLGLLRFLGYYIDMPNSRYAFVYQMPFDYFPFLRNPANLLNELKPKPLVSLLQAGEDYHMPNLETRFRLAYDLLMTVLHLRSQNIVHGNINSSNVLILPGLTSSKNDEVSLTEDLRRPYLTSFGQFSGNGPSPEALSTSMYRHPDDKRSLEDEAGWAYDLYSLGLVLLEIGLWTPVSRLWKMKYTNSMFKQRIENVYMQKLGPKCGSAYVHVVQLCLDAPNFHLSTQPFDDLNIRVPQVYHYPVLDLSAPESIFSFSMNFIYTLSKITWSCCSIDIFSAPTAEELDDCLPLALVPESETAPKKAPVRPTPELPPALPEKRPALPPRLPPRQQPAHSFSGVQMLREKMGLEDNGPKKRSCKKLTNVDIPQGHLAQWNFRLLPRLRKLLEKILKDSAESCSVTLMMTGESVEDAKTTICVTCASVKKVRAVLKKYFVLHDDAWDLIVLRGDVQRSKVPRKRRRPAKSQPRRQEVPNLNPCYQQRPTCGASIGAFKNEQHLPPVSYGGAILVDGMPYGMTVHHMMEAPSDSEDDGEDDEGEADAPLRSAGHGQGNLMHTNPDFMYAWSDEDRSDFGPSDLNFELQISDDEDGDEISFSEGLEDDDYYLSDSYSSDEEGFEDEDAASVGDTAGIEPGEEPRHFVTQPAIDDVHEAFFPSPEDRDDEHLASHALGYVHASSGVRRWTRRGVKHEIDWALIRTNDERTDAQNIVVDKSRTARIPNQQGVTRNEQGEPIYLNGVVRMDELGGLKVHCCGRTSGLQTGQISPAVNLVKLHGRQSFSTSFCVDGNFGVPGDSGAWVFEKSTGRVCGHVVAWSEKSRTAYIAPMEILIEDITRTLHATSITLPGSPHQSSAYAMPPQTGFPESPNARYSSLLPLPEQLPVGIGRLDLGLDYDPGGRGRRPVPTNTPAPYRGMPPLLAQGRGMERQLA